MKLIKLKDKFILVSDEECKHGDECITNGGLDRIGVDTFQSGISYTIKPLKIISENPHFSLLKEEDHKEIGFVDVEKLAKKLYLMEEGNWQMNMVTSEKRRAFIEGFKTAQTLNDKMFSEVEMREALSQTRKGMLYNKKYEDEYIQALQQTSWDVEVNELNQITKIL